MGITPCPAWSFAQSVGFRVGTGLASEDDWEFAPDTMIGGCFEPELKRDYDTGNSDSVGFKARICGGQKWFKRNNSQTWSSRRFVDLKMSRTAGEHGGMEMTDAVKYNFEKKWVPNKKEKCCVAGKSITGWGEANADYKATIDERGWKYAFVRAVRGGGPHHCIPEPVSWLFTYFFGKIKSWFRSDEEKEEEQKMLRQRYDLQQIGEKKKQAETEKKFNERKVARNLDPDQYVHKSLAEYKIKQRAEGLKAYKRQEEDVLARNK